VTHFNAVDLIRTKRDGGALDADSIRWFIGAYAAGDIGDEQATALLMAIVWRGMTDDELATWTAAMVDSGRRLNFESLGRPTVGKHSTGGVGDKVSLVLAPMMAACGAAVPKLSGRGLGHTGGTLDKLAAIPGFRSALSVDEMMKVLAEVGCAICAAGDDLAPADKKLYALRDVTGTVESIPLIASSIMSKKIAENTDALVLDVKFGAGAFLPDTGQARELAQTMVTLGRAHGITTTALLTSMQAPLGRAAGNALEVAEAWDTLRGDGPDDLRDVVVALSREMADLVGLDPATPEKTLNDGTAAQRFEMMIAAQGGDPAAPLPRAEHVRTLAAERSGYVTALDARSVGVAAWRLGAGRARKEDSVSSTAGVVCLAKPGAEVRNGDDLLELHSDDHDKIDHALQALEGAVEIAEVPPAPQSLVAERIGP
jgi:thymidine phosphorylase